MEAICEKIRRAFYCFRYCEYYKPDISYTNHYGDIWEEPRETGISLVKYVNEDGSWKKKDITYKTYDAF